MGQRCRGGARGLDGSGGSGRTRAARRQPLASTPSQRGGPPPSTAAKHTAPTRSPASSPASSPPNREEPTRGHQVVGQGQQVHLGVAQQAGRGRHVGAVLHLRVAGRGGGMRAAVSGPGEERHWECRGRGGGRNRIRGGAVSCWTRLAPSAAAACCPAESGAGSLCPWILGPAPGSRRRAGKSGEKYNKAETRTTTRQAADGSSGTQAQLYAVHPCQRLEAGPRWLVLGACWARCAGSNARHANRRRPAQGRV